MKKGKKGNNNNLQREERNVNAKIFGLSFSEVNKNSQYFYKALQLCSCIMQNKGQILHRACLQQTEEMKQIKEDKSSFLVDLNSFTKNLCFLFFWAQRTHSVFI